jgi:uncharacterized protein YciI
MNYVVTHRFIADVITDEAMRPHVEYLRRLFEEGKLLVTGPFTDRSGGGMFILDVSDEDELNRIVDNDPAITSGISEATVRPYQVVFFKTCEG